MILGIVEPASPCGTVRVLSLRMEEYATVVAAIGSIVRLSRHSVPNEHIQSAIDMLSSLKAQDPVLAERLAALENRRTNGS